MKTRMLIVILLTPMMWAAQTRFALGRSVPLPCDCAQHAYITKYSGKDFILALQDALSQAGYDCPVDGIHGPRTVSALRNFQGDHGLNPDGIAGPVTLAMLSKALDSSVAVTVQSVVGTEIHIDIAARKLTLFEGGVPVATFRVAVGKSSTPSPVGNWYIRRKASGWGGGFGVRFLELSVPWGIYGIHGTNKPWSVGKAISGGCFRMSNSDILKLFSRVEIGTPVRVFDPSNGHHFKRELGPGCRGADVYLLQEGLRRLGFLEDEPDGIYGPKTIDAVRAFQSAHGVPKTGHLDQRTMRLARQVLLPMACTN